MQHILVNNIACKISIPQGTFQGHIILKVFRHAFRQAHIYNMYLYGGRLEFSLSSSRTLSVNTPPKPPKHFLKLSKPSLPLKYSKSSSVSKNTLCIFFSILNFPIKFFLPYLLSKLSLPTFLFFLPYTFFLLFYYLQIFTFLKK